MDSQITLNADEASFPIEDILSIVTGRLCGEMNGFYKLLNFLEDRKEDIPIQTVELIFLIPKGSEKILRQYPELNKIGTAGLRKTSHTEWLEGVKEKFKVDSLWIARKG